MAKKCNLCGEKNCKHEKPLEVFICPSCKSHEVGYVFELGNLFGVIPKMKCRKCGYSAPIFPRLVVDKRKLVKKKKKKTGREKK